MTRKKDISQPGNGGQFAALTHTECEITLTPERPISFVPARFEPPQLGSIVQLGEDTGQITSVKGNGHYLATFANGSEFLAATDELKVQVSTIEYSNDQQTRADRIHEIHDRMAAASSTQRYDIATIYTETADGLWGFAMRRGMQGLVRACESEGRDEWLLASADRIYDEGVGVERRYGVGPDSSRFYLALTAANTAARALAVRHLIGKVPGWTQDAYDQLTRSWRTGFGSIHPEDELTPALWAKRPLAAHILEQLSPQIHARAEAYDMGAKNANKKRKRVNA